MPDWTSSMQQTFEYYVVDPGTWKDVRLIENVKSSVLTRDSEIETLGSASIDVSESLGECYVRVYLITIQNGVREKHPLGTYLVQTPSTSFDGKSMTITMDAYTPLLELKEKQPAIGYYIPSLSNIMDYAYRITRENVRAPVIDTESSETLPNDFISETSDTWLSFLTDLITNAKYGFDLDELGRILFSPKQNIASLQPIWTYTDDNSSILYPTLTMEQDVYGIPNVVEVVYSTDSRTLTSRVVNDNPNSPTSTIKRGREIVYRDTNPEITGEPTQLSLNVYAENLLKEMSTLEYEITYTHGYCPVRLGDCVRLNYENAGVFNIKAKVVSQIIKCEPGCEVTEKAVFVDTLWG